jgi:hypothetical protein
MGSRTTKDPTFEAARAYVERREQPRAETAREAHSAPSDQGPTPTAAIDLVGSIVPDPGFAWDNHVGRRNRAEDSTAATDRRRRRIQASLVGSAFVVSLGLGWLGGWNSSPLVELLYRWKPLPRDDMACSADEKLSTELAEARAYLTQTANPSYTMAQQGPEVAIERLHPEFAIRLAKALREARGSGLSSAGIYGRQSHTIKILVDPVDAFTARVDIHRARPTAAT